jgi:nuclear pore complex protein Nup133
VRDEEGRPALSFTGMTDMGGAWFSGLRQFIGGVAGGRGEIVAVSAGRKDGGSERRQVFVATRKGGLEKWELARGGSYRLCGHGDISVSMQETLRDQQFSAEGIFSIVDVALVPSADGQLVILANHVNQTTSNQAIFLCTFTDGQPPRILSGTYLPPPPPDHSSMRPAATTQPRLYVPSPGRTAFIAYSRGFSIVSLPPDLHSWSYRDTLTFRDDHPHLRIVGSGQEDLSLDATSRRKLRGPGTLLVIQGAGVVRCETFDLELGDRKVTSSGVGWIQSKVEQAVFYGVSGENPLDFKPRQEWNWKIYEVEKVVTTISREILAGSMSPVVAS